MAFRLIRGGAVDRGTFEKFRASISPAWVEAALALTGTASVRRRRLPAEQVLWLVVGMALFRNLSIEEVVRELELALPGESEVVPSAVAQARARLGPIRCAGSSSARARSGPTRAPTSWPGAA